MKGQVLNYSVQTNSGVISGEDGQRYRFSGAEWESSASSPVAGMPVDFVPMGDTATQIYQDAAVSAPSPAFQPPVDPARPGYGIRCLQCNSNVVPQGAVNWMLFIIFLLLCTPVACIYLIVQSNKPRLCPVCGGTDFQNLAA